MKFPEIRTLIFICEVFLPVKIIFRSIFLPILREFHHIFMFLEHMSIPLAVPGQYSLRGRSGPLRQQPMHCVESGPVILAVICFRSPPTKDLEVDVQYFTRRRLVWS
jgi:hypothetical protein